MAELRVLPAEPPGKDVLRVLELALELAKSGELSSIALAGILRDGGPYWNWSFAPNTSALIGSIERMKADFIRRSDE